MPASKKRFNGVLFEYWVSFMTKREANKQVTSLRKQRSLAHIMPGKDRWQRNIYHIYIPVGSEGLTLIKRSHD